MRATVNIITGAFYLLICSCIAWVVSVVIGFFGFGDSEGYRLFAFLAQPAVWVISHADEMIDAISEWTTRA